MYPLIQDPEIDWIERTGYPSWMQERDEDGNEDDAYDDDAELEDYYDDEEE